MSQFIGFDYLEAGQKIKIKGRAGEDSRFAAWEISIKSPDEEAKLEGPIQQIDPARNVLRLFNHDFILPGEILVRDLQRNHIELKVLKAGDLVKLKGKYSASYGWMPEKINMKQTMGFNVEELHGTIDLIDREQKALKVAGFDVVITEKTMIEGF